MIVGGLEGSPEVHGKEVLEVLKNRGHKKTEEAQKSKMGS